jgi:hypothetical protein
VVQSEHEIRGLVEVAVSGGVPGCLRCAGGFVGLSWPVLGGVASGSVGRVAFRPVGFVVLAGSLPLVARGCGVGFRFRHLHQGDRVRSC